MVVGVGGAQESIPGVGMGWICKVVEACVERGTSGTHSTMGASQKCNTEAKRKRKILNWDLELSGIYLNS